MYPLHMVKSLLKSIKSFQQYLSNQPGILKTNRSVSNKSPYRGVHFFLNCILSRHVKQFCSLIVQLTVVSKLRAAGFEKCELKNVTSHRKVQGLDPYNEGNSANLQ